MMSTAIAKIFMGVDVSKATLVVYRPDTNDDFPSTKLFLPRLRPYRALVRITLRMKETRCSAGSK